jgi:hypothetical protein
MALNESVQPSSIGGKGQSDNRAADGKTSRCSLELIGKGLSSLKRLLPRLLSTYVP